MKGEVVKGYYRIIIKKGLEKQIGWRRIVNQCLKYFNSRVLLVILKTEVKNLSGLIV